jgi:hypothetical protein
MNVNQQQVLSIVRWIFASFGPLIISHGYASSGTLEMAAGAIASLVPLAWSMFVHTDANAVAVVVAQADKTDSAVKGVILEQTPKGHELMNSITNNNPTAQVATAGSSRADVITKQ